MGMGTLNLILFLAMVATNILSLYHLSSSTFQSPKPPPPLQVPDHLLQQLQTIRATINRLTRHQSSTSSQPKPTIPSDLLLFSHLSPIASSCHSHPDLLHKYMSYSPYSLCPLDSHHLAESLILRGCHPLPRRRCFSKTSSKPPSALPRNPFPSSFLDSNVIWAPYSCKSFSCLAEQSPNHGFDISTEIPRFMTYKTELDLPIPQLLKIAKTANFVVRLGIDIGGNTGTFAARMKQYNVTVITTTMSFDAPNNEVVAIRGLVPLHMPLQQRLPVFDGVVDLVRCGSAVNRWIPLKMMEFMFYDVDRVLRGGGYFWVDHFFSKSVDLDKIYRSLITKLGYKKVKWAVANKTDTGGLKKKGEVYLTALLQKPISI